MTKVAFRTLIEEVLNVPPGTLTDADSRNSVEDWSSLVDVQILAMIASELGVQPDQQLQEYDTVGDLLDLLERRGALAG